MASTTSLLTGLTGLSVNARRLELIGNNIANVNTPSFKSNRALFASTFSRNLSLGSGPNDASGGSNPGQVGLGATIAGTQRNFTNGGISVTGVNTDMAIEGNGFFVVQRGGEQFFTRSGAFQLNSANELVTQSGERVQGFTVDDQFNVNQGAVNDVTIPMGSLTIAEPTTNVQFAGNLDADIDGLPTQGALLTFDQVFQNTAGTPLTPADPLFNNLDDPANPGTPLFPAGGEPFSFTISGAMKGGKTVPDNTLTVDAATTVQDFLDFINDTFSIVPGQTNPDGATTGAQIDGAGNLSIVGNIGSANNITFDQENISIEDNAGAMVANPLALTQDPTMGVADGESVRTTFTVFDSLGTPLEVDLTLAFESADNTGTRWRYFLESPDKQDPMSASPMLGTGTIQFDTDGELVNPGPVNTLLPREDTGAVTPLGFSLDFAAGDDTVTALAQIQGESSIGATSQDGSPIGTLTNFSVNQDGTINGGFSNGLSRTIGQLAFGTFTNPEGLLDIGNGLFRVGPNSGTALVTSPGEFGTGRVIGGALEQSNVDLGQEFTDMIQTTTGYSAASRVITTADQLLQTLVAIGQ